MAYQIHEYSIHRKMVYDALFLASGKQMVHSLLELNVDSLRKHLRRLRQLNKTGYTLSSFIAHCFALTLAENPQFNSMRKGNKIYVFDDVDIFFLNEATDENRRKFIHPVMIKNAGKLSGEKFNEKLNEGAAGYRLLPSQKMFLKFPGFIRKMFYSFISSRPLLFKKFFGTASVSGSYARFSTTPIHSIGKPFFTTNLFIGSIHKKPVMEGTGISFKEHVNLTFSIDHNLCDAGEALRVMETFRKKVEEDFLKFLAD